MTHVRQKRREATPSLAYPDASATVMNVGFVGPVKASSYHRSPALPFRRFEPSMERGLRFGDLTLAAAAARGVAGRKVASWNYGFGSAIALAQEQRFPVFVDADAPHYDDPTESLAGEVLGVRHT